MFLIPDLFPILWQLHTQTLYLPTACLVEDDRPCTLTAGPVSAFE